MRLETRGVVKGIAQAAFQAAAEDAKKNCPVSRALAGIPTVELVATLES
jgi:osmotically inducible protein OsmC